MSLKRVRAWCPTRRIVQKADEKPAASPLAESVY